MRFPAMGVVLVCSAVLLFSDCVNTAGPWCDPTWCHGCCSSDGKCLSGATTKACGANGQSCEACAEQLVCAEGTCVTPAIQGAGGSGGSGGSGGGSGGGSASAGGGAGGGSGGSGGGSSSGSGGGAGGAGGGGGTGSGYCLARPNGTPCTRECVHGFTCVGGFCQLNGGSGPLQITLRFPHAEDLDLHVREPLPDGGHCEIYYGDKGPMPDSGTVSSCGAQGWLDLDSNAACSIDNINIENVIYDPTKPAPSGRYDVLVDYYQFCFSGTSIDYEVEVRSNGGTRYYCGAFTPLQADEGGRGDGRAITSFNIP